MRMRSVLDAAVPGIPRFSRAVRHLAYGLSIGAVGLVTLTAEQVASAADYEIAVDAGEQMGNPRFWTACVGTGTARLTLRADLQTHYKIANRELGMRRVRGHGVLNDDMGIYRGPGNYDWTNLDTYLEAIVAAGMRPIMELDFMPTALAAQGNDKDPPGDMNAYQDFIQAVVQHCVDKYGADEAGSWYWEVWNEPDYPGFWNGTIEDYYALYDAAVDAATAVLPNVLIGGPASTWSGPTGDFLQHCQSANKRVTFVSSHNYPGGDGTSPVNPASLVSDNDNRISSITNAGFTTADVESFNTEWNSSYSGQGGIVRDGIVSMDTHANAPFIIKAVKLLADRDQGDTPPLEVFSYWAVSDVFDESGGPEGSYILGQGGNLPFGQVFGLVTFQGVRKAAFNGFKMLSYLGPTRLQTSGGTGDADGVDAIAAVSESGDEVQIIVFNYYVDVTTTGNPDNVALNVSNLPVALAGQEAFVTHFRVDETHSNPYHVWATSQNSPNNPTEAQWQEMRKEQHLALMEPVSKTTLDSSYSTTLSLPKQSASLIILGLDRPVTGRNALVDMEGEDYDGQSGITKQDCSDTSMGQSITGGSGAYIFYYDVDFSDAGVDSVEIRVNAQAATSLELHADTQTGTTIGSCAIEATNGAWTTQTCELTATTGVHTMYGVFGGAMQLNSMRFVQVDDCTDCGGTGGASSTGGNGGVPSGGFGGTFTSGGTATTGGATVSGGLPGTGGTVVVSGGTAPTGGVAGLGGQNPVGGTATGGAATPAGGTPLTGGSATTAGGQSAVGTGGDTVSTGGSMSVSEDSEPSGCGCRFPSGNRPPLGHLALLGLAGLVLLRRRSWQRTCCSEQSTRKRESRQAG